MDLLRSIKNFFGFEEEISEYPEEIIASKRKGKVLSLSSIQKEIVVIEPISFEDVQKIADHLKNQQAVVLNLQGLENELARRIVDFTSGVIYAIEGSLQKIAEGIFLFVPSSIEIISEKKAESKFATNF